MKKNYNIVATKHNTNQNFNHQLSQNSTTTNQNRDSFLLLSSNKMSHTPSTLELYNENSNSLLQLPQSNNKERKHSDSLASSTKKYQNYSNKVNNRNTNLSSNKNDNENQSQQNSNSNSCNHIRPQRNLSQNRNDGDKDGVPDLALYDLVSLQSGDNLDLLMQMSQNSDTLMSTQKQLDFLNVTANMSNNKPNNAQKINGVKLTMERLKIPTKSLEKQQIILKQNTKQSKQGMSARNDKILGNGSLTLQSTNNNNVNNNSKSQKQSSRGHSKVPKQFSLIGSPNTLQAKMQNRNLSTSNKKNGFNKPDIIKVNQQANRMSLINSIFVGSDIMSDTIQLEQSFCQEPSVRKVYKRENTSLNAAKIEVNTITVSQVSQTIDDKSDVNSKSINSSENVKMTAQQLWCIPDQFLQLSFQNHNIKYLDFQNNQIRRVCIRFLECLPNLEQLDLSKNQMISFTVKAHQKLKILNLSHNQLDNLCDEISNISNLLELNVSHNLFKRITTSIISLKQLEIFDISYNKLRDLPNGFGYLSNLSQINLQSNKLQYLPAELHHMHKITKIGLDWFQYCYPPFPIVMDKQNKRYDDMLKELQQLSLKEEENQFTKDQIIRFKAFIQVLSSKDTYIQYMDNKNRTKLHIAVLKNDKIILDYLLQIDCDFLNDLDTDNYTPLGLALKDDKFKIVERLLQENKIKIEIRCGQFNSILMLSIQKLEPLIVEKMLERGADVNIKDISSGDYPIHILVGAFNKNLTNAKKILELMVNFACDLNVKNNEQWTALHLAIKKGNYDIVQALIEISQQGIELDGIDINIQGGPERQTPLHLAVLGSYTANYKIVNLLLVYKADMFIRNINNKTAFNLVSNNLLMLKMLKKAEVKFTKQQFASKIHATEQHFINKELVGKLFRNKIQRNQTIRISSPQKRQSLSLNRQNTAQLEEQNVSETQINQAYQKLISFQDQLNSIEKYLKDPIKLQKYKNFQGQQFVSTSNIFKVDFRRNITAEEKKQINIQKEIIVEEYDNSPNQKLFNQTFSNEKFKSSSKRKQSPEAPNYQIKKLKSKIEGRRDRFSKTTQDFNNMLHTNFSSNQIPNIYFLKDSITDIEPFNKLTIQEQISIFAQFQNLFMTADEKQYNHIIELIQILNKLENDYMIERILEFIENLQISQQVNYKYKFRENLEKLQDNLDSKKIELREKIDDILTQYPQQQIYNQRFTESRLSNPQVNLDSKLIQNNLVQQNLHRVKNPFLNSGQQQREKSISFNAVYKSSNLIIPSKKQLHHPALTFNMHTNKMKNNDSVKGNIPEPKSYKEKYVMSPPLKSKLQQLPNLQLDLDQTQKMFDSNHNKISTSDKKPPLASKLVFLSPHSTAGFKNYFQEQKEEGTTPKTKPINVHTTRIKHNNRQQYKHGSITPISIQGTEDHANKMRNYHNFQQLSDTKPQQQKLQQSTMSSQQQTRQNSAYKVQKVALQNIFEGPPENCDEIINDFNFEDPHLFEGSSNLLNLSQQNHNTNNINQSQQKHNLNLKTFDNYSQQQKFQKAKVFNSQMSDQYQIYSMRKIIDSPQAPSSNRKSLGHQFDFSQKPKQINLHQGIQTKKKQ